MYLHCGCQQYVLASKILYIADFESGLDFKYVFTDTIETTGQRIPVAMSCIYMKVAGY